MPLKKIDMPSEEIGTTPAKDRPVGWFFMFEHDKHPSIVCGSCGEVSVLSDHKVQPGGRLSPSIVCPNDEVCKWHVWGELKDFPVEGHSQFDSQQLLNIALSGDIRSPLALELLAIQQQVKDLQQVDDFRDLLIFATIELGIGGKICSEFKLDVALLKNWLYGRSAPPAAVIPQMTEFIQKNITRK